MYKKKSLFVTFEGIEGSGKSHQARILIHNLKKMKIPAILTREPGGTKGAEIIRKVILKDYFHPNSKDKFNKYTDTLLYLAARNEHISYGKKFRNNKNYFNLSKKSNLKEAATNLYKTMRKIKKLKFKSIAVCKIPSIGIGIAINERLKKASYK